MRWMPILMVTGCSGPFVSATASEDSGGDVVEDAAAPFVTPIFASTIEPGPPEAGAPDNAIPEASKEASADLPDTIAPPPPVDDAAPPPIDAWAVYQQHGSGRCCACPPGPGNLGQCGWVLDTSCTYNNGASCRAGSWSGLCQWNTAAFCGSSPIQ